MTSCEHEWGTYEDIPFGERADRFKQCVKCGVVGYIRMSAFRFGDRHQKHVQPYVCSTKGCKGEAIGRLPGRRGPRNNFVWVCAACAE